jgi:hypothetical protein
MRVQQMVVAVGVEELAVKKKGEFALDFEIESTKGSYSQIGYDQTVSVRLHVIGRGHRCALGVQVPALLRRRHFIRTGIVGQCVLGQWINLEKSENQNFCHLGKTRFVVLCCFCSISWSILIDFCALNTNPSTFLEKNPRWRRYLSRL